MAESTLSYDYTRLRREIGRTLRYGRDPAAWTGTRAYQSSDVDDCISGGLARFYGDYDWQFLKPVLEIPLYAAYSTGTVTVVAGVVTLVGGSFPTWAAAGEFVVDGTAYSIATRDSNTQLTLTDTGVAAAALSTYQLIQTSYQLPDDFGGFASPHLAYRPGEDVSFLKVELMAPDQIPLLRYIDDVTDRPLRAAVIPRTRGTSAIGDRFDLLLWPPPSSAGRLLGRYRVLPNMLTGTAALTYPYGGPLHGPTIAEVCMAEAARRFNSNDDGRHEALYTQRFLPQSIRRDAEAYAPKSLGFDRGAGPLDFNSEAFAAAMLPYGLPDPLFDD